MKSAGHPLAPDASTVRSVSRADRSLNLRWNCRAVRAAVYQTHGHSRSDALGCPTADGDRRRKLSIHLSIYCALLHDVQRDQTRRRQKLSRSDAIQGDSLRPTRAHS
jgi:hypothetical protein